MISQFNALLPLIISRIVNEVNATYNITSL